MLQETKRETCDSRLMGSVWSVCQVEGWKCHRFMKKLQVVKSKFKEWNKHLSEIQRRKRKFLQSLLALMPISRKGFYS